MAVEAEAEAVLVAAVVGKKTMMGWEEVDQKLAG